MTKAELVNEIAKRTGKDKSEITEIVEQFIGTVKLFVSSGEDVTLRGFGTFGTKHRAEKTARNIAKRTAVVIPAHSVPHFKPSPEFKEAVKSNAL